MKLVYVDGVEVQVVRRKVKNVTLRVSRTNGAVVLTLPMGFPAEEAERFLQSKASWVKTQRDAVLASPMRQAESATSDELRQWRAVVQAGTELLVEKWAPVIDAHPKTLAYRNMRSRWGSCTPDTGRVCINVRLALYPPRCLEYVVVHGLCHFHARNHGADFKALMDRYLPDWRETKKILDA